MTFASPVFSMTIIVFYVLGFICASSAILRARTPQGATAWIVGLLTMPFFTVPLYILFGRSKFYGYTLRRKSLDDQLDHKFTRQHDIVFTDEEMPELAPLVSALRPLVKPGFTCRNSVRLLKDGEETFRAMLADLETAKSYIIFQFYVFRADSTGWKFAEVLIRKAREGVRVTFLYDEMGSEVPTEFLDQLRAAGIHVHSFNTLRGKARFQINFRNHRKIVVVDGRMAYVGGLNIGDDYLGLWPELGPWRDTHLRLEGPSVMVCQMTHAKDWYWCSELDLEAEWKVAPTEGSADVLVLPTGPADEKQSCLLAHIAMVNAAKERLWIANPYLVPPESLLDAILLAALRGVDVRIIIPSYSDAWIVLIACQVYVSRLLNHGVKVYRYAGGFLHEKVMLVDDCFATVGSANLDFRSMFINFEITVVVREGAFLREVTQMLEEDLRNSAPVTPEEFEHQTLWKRIKRRGANLLAPIL